MALTACAAAQPGGGESVLDGVAGGGCGAEHFSARGASVSERPQHEERGDGERDAGRDREQPGHGARWCGRHHAEPEAKQETRDGGEGRRERPGGKAAGFAERCPGGTARREAYVSADSTLVVRGSGTGPARASCI